MEGRIKRATGPIRGSNCDPVGPGLPTRLYQSTSALQEQSSAFGVTWAAFASALQAQSASATIGAKLGLSTPQAIPAAATNLSIVIIAYSPPAATRRFAH